MGVEQRPLGPARFEFVTGEDFYTAALDRRIKALVGFGGNLVMAHADSLRGREALRSLDFFVQADLFMTPTAELADIVLPVTTPFESEALKIGFEYSQEAQSLVQLRQPLVAPRGEARSDLQIVFDLATRLGLGAHFWDGDIEAAFRHQLAPSGITLEELRAHPEGVRVPLTTRYRKYADTGFATPSRKVELYSATLAAHGYSPLPAFEEPLTSPRSRPDLADRYPLVLSCAKSLFFCETQHRQVAALRKSAPDPQVEMHPSTAAARGICAGDWVSLDTPHGAVRARAKLNASLDPQVVFAQHGWWEACDELGLPGYPPFGPGQCEPQPRAAPDAERSDQRQLTPEGVRLRRLPARAGAARCRSGAAAIGARALQVFFRRTEPVVFFAAPVVFLAAGVVFLAAPVFFAALVVFLVAPVVAFVAAETAFLPVSTGSGGNHTALVALTFATNEAPRAAHCSGVRDALQSALDLDHLLLPPIWSSTLLVPDSGWVTPRAGRKAPGTRWWPASARPPRPRTAACSPPGAPDRWRSRCRRRACSIARLKSMDTRPSGDGGGTSSWRLAGYVVMPDVASRNRIHRLPSSSPHATSRCRVPAYSKTTSPTASPVGRGVGLEATRQDPAGVGRIAGSAAVGPQVRRVRMPGAHDGAAVTVGHLGDGVAEGHRQPHLVQRSEPVHARR